MPKKNTYEPFYEIEHTADKGLCAHGHSLEELFRNMFSGMYQIIFSDIKGIYANESNLHPPVSPLIKEEEKRVRTKNRHHIQSDKRDPSTNKIELICLKELTPTDLLVSWLSEINFLLIVKNFLIKDIIDLNINKENDSQYILKAKLSGGDKLDYKTLIKTEIKAVTYHQLKIEKVENRYTGQVIFDV
jgi:SHS2 domain-containing protein